MKSNVSLSYLFVAALFGAMLAGAIAFPTAGASEGSTQPSSASATDIPPGCADSRQDMRTFLVGYFKNSGGSGDPNYGSYEYVDLTSGNTMVGPQGVPIPNNVPMNFTTAVKFTTVPASEVDNKPTVSLNTITCRRHALFVPLKADTALYNRIKFTAAGKLAYVYETNVNGTDGKIDITKITDHSIIYMDGSHVVTSTQRGIGTGTLGYETDTAVTNRAGQLIVGIYPALNAVGAVPEQLTLTEPPSILLVSPDYLNNANTHVPARYASASYNGTNTDNMDFTAKDTYFKLDHYDPSSAVNGDEYWKAAMATAVNCDNNGDSALRTRVLGLYTSVNSFADKCGMRKVECNP